MLADCTHVSKRGIGVENSRYIGTQEIDKCDDAMWIAFFIGEILRPSHLAAGIRRHEFCPHCFDDMKLTGISQVVVWKIASG
jgi:hypothetical protein